MIFLGGPWWLGVQVANIHFAADPTDSSTLLSFCTGAPFLPQTGGVPTASTVANTWTVNTYLIQPHCIEQKLSL